jgi:hypothetical protein
MTKTSPVVSKRPIAVTLIGALLILICIILRLESNERAENFGSKRDEHDSLTASLNSIDRQWLARVRRLNHLADGGADLCSILLVALNRAISSRARSGAGYAARVMSIAVALSFRCSER